MKSLPKSWKDKYTIQSSKAQKRHLKVEHFQVIVYVQGVQDRSGFHNIRCIFIIKTPLQLYNA